MVRSESELARRNTYWPGASTVPGTSTGALNVTVVFLFHSSARAAGMNNRAKKNEARAVLIICSSCLQRRRKEEDGTSRRDGILVLRYGVRWLATAFTGGSLLPPGREPLPHGRG